MPLASPFDNRSVASNSVTYAVPPQRGSPIVSGLQDIIGLIGKGGERAERDARTGLLKSQTAAVDQKTGQAVAHESNIVNAVRQIDEDRAAGKSETEIQRNFLRNVAPNFGTDDGAKGLSALQRNQVAIGAAGDGTTNPTPTSAISQALLSTLMAADGHALNKDQDLTAAGHDARVGADRKVITDRDTAASADRRYDTDTDASTSRANNHEDNATSRSNNGATNATSRRGQDINSADQRRGQSMDAYTSVYNKVYGDERRPAGSTTTTTTTSADGKPAGTKTTVKTPGGRGPARPAAAAAASPPVSGAKKAPDGNWYVPDPARRGKFLKVG